MLPVSAEFQAAALAPTRHPLQRVTCWFQDNRTLQGMATITVPGELDATVFPKQRLLNARTAAPQRWALARADCYPADDLYPIDQQFEGGWFSDTAAGAGGVVSPSQEIILEYSTAQSVTTLEVWADDWLGLPVDFQWHYWDSEQAIYLLLAEVNGNTAEHHQTTLLAPVLSTKFKFVLHKISRANDYPAVVELQTGMSADLSSRVQGLTIVKERSYRQEGSIALGNTAAAELTLTLDNADGAFYTGNTSSPYYGRVLPNRKLLVELGFVLADGSEEYCDAGIFYASSWRSPARSTATTVRALDGWKLLRRMRYQCAVVEGSTISELAATVAAAGGFAGGDVAIDETEAQIPYAALDDRTLFEHLRELAMGEGGAVYFDESGILCFENREHLAGHAASGVTIDQDNAVEDITDEVDEGPLVNRVRVLSERLKEDVETTIWSLQETLYVRPLDTATIEVRFQRPAVGIQGPVLVSGGAHITVDSYSYQSYGGTVVLSNSSSAQESVTEMTIAGKLLVADGQIVAEASAPISIADYGEQTYSLTDPYIQSREQAQALADDLLAAYNALGTELTVQMKARGLPHLQLGDRVHVDCTPAHISADGWVVRSRLTLDDGLSGELTVLTEGQPVPDYGHGYITGTVQLEGRTDYSGVLVTTTGVGEPVVTGADGTFTLQVRPGSGITVTAGRECYLSALKTGVMVELNDTTDIGTTTLLAGDANGDRIINSTDLLIVLSSMGLPVPPAPSRADIDGDGLVDSDDLDLVLAHVWDTKGPTAW